MNSRKEELEKFRKLNGPLIDVRSPGEYYKGHMPNSINIPLFDNEERSIVGTKNLLCQGWDEISKYMLAFRKIQS